MFFFFQAEDGIRDRTVTGVQTCALPICLLGITRCLALEVGDPARAGQALQVGIGHRPVPDLLGAVAVLFRRSEERRVGKECRLRWLPYYFKINMVKISIRLRAHGSTSLR